MFLILQVGRLRELIQEDILVVKNQLEMKVVLLKRSREK